MKKGILFTLVIIASIIGAVIGIQSSTSDDIDTEISTAPAPRVSPTSVPTVPTTPTAPRAEIPQDWKLYESERHSFSLYYPAQMTVEPNIKNVPVFTFLGDTQPRDSEISDGVLVSIESGTYNTSDFKTFVDTEHSAHANEPITESISAITTRSIAGREGYQYTRTGLGETTHLYLSDSPDTYYHIYYILEDPQSNGYDYMLNTMLSSFSPNR